MFPILSAAPPPGEEDPEDEENDTEGDSENPKHFAVQVGVFTCFISLTQYFPIVIKPQPNFFRNLRPGFTERV